MEYKVSIIVPVYRVEQSYLKRCIDSVKKQIYKNYECIILCDGANKDIQDFIKQYTVDDLKFKVIIKENTGVSDTRNQGIKLCNGEYITFLDADDWLEDDALDCFNKTIEENIDFYIFKTNIVKNNIKSQYKVKKSYDHYISQKEKNILFQSVYGTRKGEYHWIESVWAKFYRRDFINEKKIFFMEDVKVGEDLLFNLDVWSKSALGKFVNKEIYNYRINEKSVMNSNYNQLLINYRKLNEKILEKNVGLKKEYKNNYEVFMYKQLKKFFLKYQDLNEKTFYELIDEYNIYINNISITSLGLMDMFIIICFKYKFEIGLKLMKKLYKYKSKTN